MASNACTGVAIDIRPAANFVILSASCIGNRIAIWGVPT
jgi:hypothetical protein